MVFEKIRDWQRYLENVMGVDFQIDGKNAIYNLLKKSPMTDEFDTKDVFTLEFFSAVLDDIDTLSESINEYPGSFSFTDPFDDLSNWVTVSGSPAIESGKLKLSAGDEVSRVPTINGDKVAIKMQAPAVSGTPVGSFIVDATATAQIIEIKIDDSKLKYDNGTENDLQAVSNDTEYLVEIYCDFTNNTLDIYVDSIIKASNVPFETDCDKVFQYRMKVESGTIQYYNDCSSLSEFTTFGTPVIDAGRIKCPAGGIHQAKWTNTGNFTLATVYKIKMETDNVSGTPSGYISTNSTSFFTLFSVSIFSGQLLWNSAIFLQNVSNSTEYEIEVIVDWVTRTCEVKVDGDSKGTSFPLGSPNALDFNQIELSNASNRNIWFDDLTIEANQIMKYDDYLNEFIGSHPAVITPANCIYKDKHREQHWWTVVWEVWN